MFDATYFQEHLTPHIQAIGAGSTSVHVHLYNGVIHKLRQVVAVEPGFVLLEVFPEDGVSESTRELRRKPGGDDSVFWDRVAVSYESITQVFFTVAEPAERRFIGFVAPT